jgi:hypothetical protein
MPTSATVLGPIPASSDTVESERAADEEVLNKEPRASEKAKKIGICIKMVLIYNNGKLYILVWSQSFSYRSCISSKDPDSRRHGLDPQH